MERQFLLIEIHSGQHDPRHAKPRMPLGVNVRLAIFIGKLSEGLSASPRIVSPDEEPLFGPLRSAIRLPL